MRDLMSLFFDFYRRPLRAPSRAVDEANFGVAIIAAVLAAVLLNAAGPEASGFGGFQILALLAIVFVPSAILILVTWKSAGSFTTAVFRDFAPLLVCALLAFSAAYLPLALARGVVRLTHAPAWINGFLVWPFHLYFAFLLMSCLRTVMGVRFVTAIVIASGAAAMSVAGVYAYSALGHLTYYLASPWILYFGYNLIQADLRFMSAGLSSRQSLKRSLAAATINPRDSEAQYQLGLLYQHRRQYDDAIARFRKAVEIDPREADAHFQLGRIAMDQKRYDDALASLCNTVELDDRHSSNEVWREIGIACFHLRDFTNATAALAKYTDRREYDPEGLYWYGKSLVAAGRKHEAKQCFERAVEAAQTMPRHRRGKVREWASKAKSEVKALA